MFSPLVTKQAAKYKDILPLVEEISALQIGIDELIALKVGINQTAKHYDLSPLTSTLRLIEDIKKNKIDGLYEFANLSEIPNLIVRPVN